MFSSATQPPPPRPPPPRHYFLVSAITFEWCKLRSSNLTHALLIQISRTSSIIDIVVRPFCQKNSKKKLRIDLKWPEMRSKVIFGHPKWPLAAILSKKNSSVWIWNGQKCNRKWILDIPNGRRKKNSVSIWNGQNCYWKWISDIQNGRSIWFCQKFQKKIKNSYWSKMARNAIEREFRTSKMPDGSHFVKNFKNN